MRLLTRDIGPRGILNIETEKVLEIQEDRVQGIELIGEPEVREAHVEKGRAEYATEDAQRPESGLVPQRFCRIEQEQCEERVEQHLQKRLKSISLRYEIGARAKPARLIIKELAAALFRAFEN